VCKVHGSVFSFGYGYLHESNSVPVHSAPKPPAKISFCFDQCGKSTKSTSVLIHIDLIASSSKNP
jgi:hypothetical protein